MGQVKNVIYDMIDEDKTCSGMITLATGGAPAKDTSSDAVEESSFLSPALPFTSCVI